MLELAGEQREWIDIEHAAQLVVAQPEQLHQPGRAIALGAAANLRIVALGHRPRSAAAGGDQKSWFSPPNTSLTDPSVKIWRIELVSRSAHESTRTLSGAPAGSGRVSVTTICSSPADPS